MAAKDALKVAVIGGGNIARKHLPVLKDHTCFASQLPSNYEECDGNELGVVPFILQHGDVLQWAALLADRQVAIRNLPAEAGCADVLRSIFETLGNAEELSLTLGPTNLYARE